MRSEIVHIDNQGCGFKQALEETARLAWHAGLNSKQSLQLRLCTEEMLSLAKSVTGEMEASFYLACEGKAFDLHMKTKAVLDKEKRQQLIASSSSRRNEAANSFLGMLRDAFERAMAAEADHTYYELPEELAGDVSGKYAEEQEWDRYERSILRRVADDVKIAIRGGVVEMTVAKSFN